MPDVAPCVREVEGEGPFCGAESSATSTLGGGRSPEHEEHKEQLECRAIFIAKSSGESWGISCEAGYNTFIVIAKIKLLRASASGGRRRLRRRGRRGHRQGLLTPSPIKFQLHHNNFSIAPSCRRVATLFRLKASTTYALMPQIV